VYERATVAVLDTGEALRFPRECPRCGLAAHTRVRVTKIFARGAMLQVVVAWLMWA